MVTTTRKRRNTAALILFAGLCFVLTMHGAFGDPTGASILSNSTAGVPTSPPSSRADARATITTLVLNAVQQDQFWKAYVGNVSGRLSLDNANGFTIYDWELFGSIGGEVYVARNQSLDFTDLSCANTTNIAAENTFFGMSATAVDNINNTYNESSHAAVPIGGLPSSPIAANSCPSMATFINDTRQTINGTQTFQALVLQENASGSLVFTTIIADDTYGYDNNISLNKSYDFQIIIPEADSGAATAYYFWTELNG